MPVRHRRRRGWRRQDVTRARAADKLAGEASVLWGACDSLSTPRALGPLSDIAAQTGGELADNLASGASRDAVFRAAPPEALRYDPSTPEPRLLGVEYVVFVADWGEDRDPPVLFGHQFHLVDAGNRYGLPPFCELHAWIWHHNPSGLFEDWNSRIDC